MHNLIRSHDLEELAPPEQQRLLQREPNALQTVTAEDPGERSPTFKNSPYCSRAPCLR